MNFNIIFSFLRFRVLLLSRTLGSLPLPTSGLRLFPKFCTISLVLFASRWFLIIIMTSLEDTKSRIVFLLLMMLLTCCLKRLKDIAIKINISKAFDTLSLNFLLQVLHHFSFHPTFINWIMLSCNLLFFQLRSMVIWLAILIMGGMPKGILCRPYFYVWLKKCLVEEFLWLLIRSFLWLA